MKNTPRENHTILIPVELKPKFDKYCKSIFGKPFDESLYHRMTIEVKKFIDGIKDHIESAEKMYGKNYLKIKE